MHGYTFRELPYQLCGWQRLSIGSDQYLIDVDLTIFVIRVTKQQQQQTKQNKKNPKTTTRTEYGHVCIHYLIQGYCDFTVWNLGQSNPLGTSLLPPTTPLRHISSIPVVKPPVSQVIKPFWSEKTLAECQSEMIYFQTIGWSTYNI